MGRFPFDELPRYRGRRYLPEDLRAGSWEAVEPYFDELERRVLKTPADLERWLLDKSEVAAALGHEGTLRHTRTTLDTEDKDIAEAWKRYVREISPKASPHWHRLSEIYLACPARKKLDKQKWFVYDRDVDDGFKLYRKENIPLGTEASMAEQEFNQLTGAMGATIDGKEYTAVSLGEELQESNDRDKRRRAWRALWDLYLEREDDFEGIYDRLLSLRRRMAANAGFPDYRSYAWRSKGRYDYTPEDCIAFHDAIEATVLPLVRKLAALKRERLGLDQARPWDVRVDPWNRPPLMTVPTPSGMCESLVDILGSIDPQLQAMFRDEIAARGLVDLDSRRGKAPGGYQTVFAEASIPFIFNNGSGVDDDITILAHEAGHAFHSLLSRDQELLAYRHSPLEFAEVASSAMEFFTYEHMDRVHRDREDLARSRWYRLNRVIEKFIGVGTYDGFQHWVYTSPEHTRAQRQETWRRVHERFDPRADWTELEKERSVQWWAKLHLFVAPFYYVEYGIAYVGALQLWQRYRKDRDAAVAAYKRALALGGSRPLPELWEAAGLEFDFSADMLGRIMRDVEKEFDRIVES